MPALPKPLRIALVAAGVVFLALLLLAVGLRILASGGAGRWAVQHYATGFDIAGCGELSLEGVTGDILSSFAISRLEIADAEGVWLTARDVGMDWRPRALAAGRLDIRAVSAREITVLRPPVRADREPGGGPPSISVRIDRLAVDALRLEEDVIGQAATLRLASEIERDSEGALVVAARAERTDAPGDEAALDFRQSAAGEIAATLRAVGAAGGPLALLLRAPDSPVALDGRAEGRIERGEGSATLQFGADRAGDLQARWAAGDFEAEGRLEPVLWPAVAALRNYFADTVRFEAAGRYRGGFALTEAILTAPDIVLVLAPDGDQAWRVEATVSGGRLYALTGERVAAETAIWSGRARLDDGLEADGVLTASDVAYLGFGAAEVSGPLALAGSLTQPELTADLALTGATYPDETLARVLGPAPRARLQTQWARDNGRFDFAALELMAGESRVAGAGAIFLEEDRYSFGAEFSLAGFEPFTDIIRGRADGRAEIAGGFDGALTLEIAGRATCLGGPAWIETLGESAQFTASGARAADGALTLSQARLEMRNALAEWTADWGPGGVWRAQGDAAVTAALSLGPLGAEGGAALAFEAVDEGEGLVWRLEAVAEDLSMGGATLDAPVLRVQGRGGAEAFGADVRFTADSEYGDIDLAGRIVHEDETYRLETVTGSAGPVAVRGEGDFSDDSASAEARARWNGGAGAPDIAADLAFESEGEDASIDARLTVGEWYFGARGARLDALTLTARGGLDEIVITLAARGAYGDPWRFDATGAFSLGAGGWSVRLTPTGEIAGFALAADRPFQARSTETGFVGEADWLLGGGRFSVSGGRDDGVNRLDVAVVDAPAELAAIIRPWMRPDGLIDARLAYLRSPDSAEGDFRFEMRGLNPAGADPDGALDLTIDAALRNGRFEATATGGGGGLALEGVLSADIGPGLGVTDIRDASAAPVRGRLSISGPIDALGGFHLPESQTIQGRINAEAVLSGTIGAPQFEGSMSIRDGGFRDIRQGVNIAAANAEGRFSGDGVTLDSLTATDGDRGVMSGSGRISFADARPAGEVNVTWRNFRIVDRADLETIATGSAEIALSADGRIDVTGESVLDRVEARPPQSSQASFVEIEVIEINAPPGQAPPPAAAPSRIHLDYRVSAPGRVYVRGPSFDSEWSLDIRVRGPTGAPKLVGAVDLERGEAVLIGRRFAFVSGVIRFNGLPETGVMNVTAERAAPDLTARIRVAGPVSGPEITLSSQPSLPQDEILARILFDRSAGSLSALEAAQLAALVSNTAGGGGAFAAFDRIRSLAGIDRLSVRSGADGGAIVSGGRYIDDDVYLEIEAGGDGAASTAARIEWTLRPNLTLVSRLTGSTDASVSLRWRREFD